MKRIVLSLVLIVAFSTSVKAQYTPNVAISLGAPVGDINSSISAALSIDGYYMKYLNDSFDVGLTAGYSFYQDKKDGDPNTSSVSFLPIAAAFRYKFGAALSVGTDLGYAVGLSDNTKGGLYYKPVVGYDIGKSGQIMLSFQGISSGSPSPNSIGIGYAYAF